MDAPRDFLNLFFLFFLFFLRTSSAQGGGGGGGGGVRCQTFSFSFFPCSADHERDWPPCKVVFFGLATNALNVRNNNNKKQQQFAAAWHVMEGGTVRSKCERREVADRRKI